MAKTELRKLQEKVWDECKRIIRKRYQNKDGAWSCFTCGKILIEPAKVHTGHFIPSAVGGASLRYDLRNLRPQCYACNINYGGNGAIYYKKMVETEGQEYVDKIFQDKHKTVKADKWYYQEMLERYTELEQ